jgi:hypothetical protein
MRKLALILFCLLIAVLPVVSAQDETTYKDDKYGFTISYPSGLRAIKNYQPNVPLTILLQPKSIFFNNQIIVTVSNIRPSSKSTEEMIDIVFKYDRTVEERKDVTNNGIKFTSVIQTQERKILFFPLRLKLYHLIAAKGNRIYTITYIATQDSFNSQLEEAKSVMHSFKFT